MWHAGQSSSALFAAALGQILKVELNVLVSPPASGTIIGPVA